MYVVVDALLIFQLGIRRVIFVVLSVRYTDSRLLTVFSFVYFFTQPFRKIKYLLYRNERVFFIRTETVHHIYIYI